MLTDPELELLLPEPNFSNSLTRLSLPSMGSVSKENFGSTSEMLFISTFFFKRENKFRERLTSRLFTFINVSPCRSLMVKSLSESPLKILTSIWERLTSASIFSDK